MWRRLPCFPRERSTRNRFGPRSQSVKEPLLSKGESRGFGINRVKSVKNRRKTEPSQLHLASFVRFMAANLSLTYLVTAAKPRWRGRPAGKVASCAIGGNAFRLAVAHGHKQAFHLPGGVLGQEVEGGGVA